MFIPDLNMMVSGSDLGTDGTMQNISVTSNPFEIKVDFHAPLNEKETSYQPLPLLMVNIFLLFIVFKILRKEKKSI